MVSRTKHRRTSCEDKGGSTDTCGLFPSLAGLWTPLTSVASAVGGGENRPRCCLDLGVGAHLVAGTAVWVLGTIMNPLFRDLIAARPRLRPPRPGTWAEPEPLPRDASPNERAIFPLHLLENIPTVVQRSQRPPAGGGDQVRSRRLHPHVAKQVQSFRAVT